MRFLKRDAMRFLKRDAMSAASFYRMGLIVRDTTRRPLRYEMRAPLRGAAAILAALVLGSGAWAQDSSSVGAASEDELFGAETITVSESAADAAPQASFLEYDEVKVGGSFTGSAALSASWEDPWGGSADLLEPDARSLDPVAKGRITITAKPSSDFGVNMDFRSAWPFSSSYSVSTLPSGSASFAVPDISVWALYSKFSWKDSLFFSFGKQPLSWGVSKSAFQPADDIFALGAVDYGDTQAEREGPVAFKLHYPVPLTMTNFYLYAGIPAEEELKPEDARIAAKAEFNLGNTEFAFGGYYSYNDNPRALAMATTGTGDFNFFGEAVLKYGSERIFLERRATPLVIGALSFPFEAVEGDGRFYFIGTLGGYYRNSDANLTISASYLYNGEAQTEVDANDLAGHFRSQTMAGSLYTGTLYEIDAMRLGTHYAFLSLSKSELIVEELSISCYALANLSDLSGIVSPGLSYELFDYLKLSLGATFTFGEDGDEYTNPAANFRKLATPSSVATPRAAISLTLTAGSGSF